VRRKIVERVFVCPHCGEEMGTELVGPVELWCSCRRKMKEFDPKRVADLGLFGVIGGDVVNIQGFGGVARL